jgi:hypothetical protein
MAGAGRRLALEGAFLVGLAVAAGLAELSTEEIIAVMALGWLLTVLIELVAWRLSLRRPAAVREDVVASPAPAAAEPPVPVVGVPEPDAESGPDEEPEPEAHPEAPVDPEEAAARAQDEAGGLRTAEPKRGGIFGWRRRDEEPGEITDETPAPPKHVRLIERAAVDDEGEGAGDQDAPPAERARGA